MTRVELLERWLVATWRRLLDRPDVAPADNPFDLGATSIDVLHGIAAIRTSLGIDVSASTIYGAATLAELAASLAGLEGPARPDPVVRIKANGRLPALCGVHPLSGLAAGFAHLTPHLEADRPLWACQAPGVFGECTPLDTIEDLASVYVDALVRLQPEGPHHLLGFSLGGHVAFEMASQLRARGQRPGVLGLVDPGFARPVDIEEVGDRRGYWSRWLRRQLYGPSFLPAEWEELRRLDPEAQVDQVVSMLRRARLAGDPYVGRQYLLPNAAGILRVQRAGQTAFARYVHRPWAGSAVLFRLPDAEGDGDEERWRGLVTGGLRTIRLAGDHSHLLEGASGAAIVETLTGEFGDRPR